MMKKFTFKLKMTALFMVMMVSQAFRAQSPCAASFTYVINAAGNVVFYSTSTNTTSATSFNWYLSGSGSIGTGTTTTYNFNFNGVYTIGLSMVNSAPTCSSTSTQTISITNSGIPCALVANFSTTQGAAGLVNFVSTSTGTTGSTAYSWIFGDNSATASSNAAAHTYSADGNYMVTLNIVSGACSGSISKNVKVCSYNPVTASFVYSQNQGIVSYSSTSTGTANNTSYYWQSNTPGGTANGVNLTQTSALYTSGTYYMMLWVTNPVSTCSASSTQTIVVSNSTLCLLNANFTASQFNGSNTFNFVNISSGTNSGTTYSWNFGDNSTSTIMHPSHTYSASGGYIATLTANNNTNNNCVSTQTMLICFADVNFTLSPSGTPQLWNAFPSVPGNITSATWNWGDGSTSNTLFTSHMYASAGTYSICLTVTNSCGATDYYCNAYAIFKSSEAGQASDIIQVNVIDPSAVSIKKNSAEAFAPDIIPNPNTGRFTLDFQNTNNKYIILEVYDPLGKLVNKQHIETKEASLKNEVDLHNIPDGIYLLKITSGRQISTKKLIIKN